MPVTIRAITEPERVNVDAFVDSDVPETLQMVQEVKRLKGQIKRCQVGPKLDTNGVPSAAHVSKGP